MGSESYDVELLVKTEAGTDKDIAYDIKKISKKNNDIHSVLSGMLRANPNLDRTSFKSNISQERGYVKLQCWTKQKDSWLIC